MLAQIERLRDVLNAPEPFREEVACARGFSAYTPHSAALDAAMLKLHHAAATHHAAVRHVGAMAVAARSTHALHVLQARLPNCLRRKRPQAKPQAHGPIVSR